MDRELSYYLSFSHFLGVGPVRFRTLLDRFGNAKHAYEASYKDIRECVGDNFSRKFIEFRNRFDPVKKIEELKAKGIHVIVQTDVAYPSLLKNISDPPICIYAKGNLKCDSPDKALPIGVVGTRRPTAYGQFIADYFSSQLVSAGCVIVSGMAIGIDGIAHRAALREGGQTIAVLGCGVDIVYPRFHAALYDQIIRKGGLIISEFPPGQTVRKGLFVARNRIISGLSKGILVVEGTKDSGSLITAKFAAEQGRDVFAPPVPLNSEMSQAPNILLKQGAKFVTDPNDILEEYNLKAVAKKNVHILSSLSAAQALAYKELLQQALFADELALKCMVPIQEILSLLSGMEIQGIIKRNSEGKYEIMHA